MREGALISAFLLGIVLLVALLSYSPQDPGFTTTGSGEPVNNAIGHMGAWLADVLLHMFGYFAYIFPLALGFKVFSLFRDSSREREFSWMVVSLKVMGIVLLVIGACTLATLHFAISDDNTWPAGGLIGSAMADASVPVLAIFGSTLVYLSIFLFGLTVTFEISWLKLVDRIGYWTINGVARANDAMRAWQEKREEANKVKQGVEKRKKALDVRIEKEKKRTPPRIEPVLSAPPQRSQRVEKERQTCLLYTSPSPRD